MRLTPFARVQRRLARFDAALPAVAINFMASPADDGDVVGASNSGSLLTGTPLCSAHGISDAYQDFRSYLQTVRSEHSEPH
jgi:hypothetical protein